MMCRNRLRLGRLFAVGLLFSLIALCFTWQAKTVEGQESLLAEAVGKSDKYALLIGVTKYNHAAMNNVQLEFPEVDAKAMAAVFRNSGYTVDLLLGAQATQIAIRKKLEEFSRRGTNDGVALIGLFGHGTEPEGTQTAYYCPYDTELTVIKDRQGRPIPGADGQDQVREDPNSLIGMPELLEALKLSPAGNRVLLADCCRNDPHRPRSRAFGSQLKASDIPPNTVAFFACSAGQQAFEHQDWGHGAFTKCLLEEINRMAATGKVRMATLTDQVQEKVERLVSEKSNERVIQTPYPLIVGSVDLQLSRDRISTLPPQLLRVPFSIIEFRKAQLAWGRHLNQPVTSKNSIDLELVLIPAGEYLRGSTDMEIQDLLKDIEYPRWNSFEQEKPQHQVRITQPFNISRCEITQRQFEQVLRRNPAWFSPKGKGQGDVKGLDTQDFAIENVTWYDCIEFCNKLSELEGRSYCYELSDIERRDNQSIQDATVRIIPGSGYRLPTEGEWEFACRAGTTSHFHFGDGFTSKLANTGGEYQSGGTYKEVGLNRPTKVGSYPANAFGIHDMCGNVEEWCQDNYDESLYRSFASQVAIDPLFVDDYKPHKVLRGGGWSTFVKLCRSASRRLGAAGDQRLVPDKSYSQIGFRIVRSMGN